MIAIQTGISIIMNRWLDVQPDELILLVTDETHLRELDAFEHWARSQDTVLKTVVLESESIQNGSGIEAIAPMLMRADVILGATDYSFITTRQVTDAVTRGARFISLPLSCSDGTSLLENDFIDMNPNWTRHMANRILRPINRCNSIHVTTALGTDLLFYKRGRVAGTYFGMAARHGVVSSSSFEVYVPIEEYSTDGRLVLDGSLGYLGLVSEPVALRFEKGKLSVERMTPDAERLINYLDSFHDAAMYQAAEFGIGLNSVSRCRGVSYIEDESAYRTFHIGMGRNISLGGQQEAAGHFDIVTHLPTITAGDTVIMRDGEIV